MDRNRLSGDSSTFLHSLDPFRTLRAAPLPLMASRWAGSGACAARLTRAHDLTSASGVIPLLSEWGGYTVSSDNKWIARGSASIIELSPCIACSVRVESVYGALEREELCRLAAITTPVVVDEGMSEGNRHVQ